MILKHLSLVVLQALCLDEISRVLPSSQSSPVCFLSLKIVQYFSYSFGTIPC